MFDLIWFAIPLLVLTLALVVVAAVAASVWVYRVGDSGARAAWGDRVASTQKGQ